MENILFILPVIVLIIIYCIIVMLYNAFIVKKPKKTFFEKDDFRYKNYITPKKPLIKPTKVLCKRTETCGDNYYWDDMKIPAVKVYYDNRMIVAGDWYDVIYNENDTDETFTIRNNQGKPELHWMYGEENDNNYNLPRTYAKWFYTAKELEKKQIREKAKIKNMNNTKKIAEYSLDKMEQLTERYTEAEKFIMNLNWFERLFCSRKITNFLISRSEKYNF